MHRPITDAERRVLVQAVKDEAGITINSKPFSLDELTATLAEIVPQEIVDIALDRVALFFTYSLRESHVTQDGSTVWITHDQTGERLFALGISQEAITGSTQYCALVFLHELCHVLCPDDDHGELFHSMLNQLLIMTEAASGERISNDYYGLPADSLPE